MGGGNELLRDLQENAFILLINYVIAWFQTKYFLYLFEVF